MSVLSLGSYADSIRKRAQEKEAELLALQAREEQARAQERRDEEMAAEQERIIEARRQLARMAGQQNKELMAEIALTDQRQRLSARMRHGPLGSRKVASLAEADHEQDLVLGEAAIEALGIFRQKATQATSKIKELNLELKKVEAMTNRYKQIYEEQMTRDRKKAEAAQKAAAAEAAAKAAALALAQGKGGKHARQQPPPVQPPQQLPPIVPQPPPPPPAENSADEESNGGGSEFGQESTVSSHRKARLRMGHDERLVLLNTMHTKIQLQQHDNEMLMHDVERVRVENGILVERLKRAEKELEDYEKMSVETEEKRRKMQDDLERENKQHRILWSSITSQAAKWVSQRQALRAEQEELKWSKIIPYTTLHESIATLSNGTNEVRRHAREMMRSPGSHVSQGHASSGSGAHPRENGSMAGSMRSSQRGYGQVKGLPTPYGTAETGSQKSSLRPVALQPNASQSIGARK